MACISSWYIALVLLAAAIQIQAQSNVYQENNKASTECKWIIPNCDKSNKREILPILLSEPKPMHEVHPEKII